MAAAAGAGAAAAAAAGAGPVPAKLTFRDLYEDPDQDPYDGDYREAMRAFIIPAAGAWTAATLYNRVLAAGDVTSAYVGLFEDPDHPEGLTRLVHDPKMFPMVIGRATPFDNVAYAFLDDVSGTSAVTVVFPDEAFQASSLVSIPGDIASAATLWAADTTLAILDPIATAAGGQARRVPSYMFVPPKYIGLFIGRRLSPRQLVEEVLAQVVADGLEAELEAFVHWCLYAGVASAAGGDASDIVQQDPAVPIGNAAFLEWRAARLDVKLPDLRGAGMAAQANATTRIASIMTQLLQEQRDARTDAADARSAARAPKTVSEYFKVHMTNKLMILCMVADEGDLPDLYSELAAANGKRDREVIDLALREIANELDLPELAPVVTPGLAKKITCLRFAGSNMDDLDEGISPFSMIIMDHTTPSGSAAYSAAMEAAHDYDDLLRGSSTADLADLKAVKGSKALLPETYTLARAMLQAFKIVLTGLLGETHRVQMAYTRFLRAYINRENFYTGRLQLADAKMGPARLLRHVQLLTRAWFQGIWEAPTVTAANAVPVPDYMAALNKMAIGDMAWFPVLPPTYVRTVTPTPDEDKPKATGQKRASQVSNTRVNPKFEDFRTGISQTKFNDAIRRVGDPPKVTRSGKECVMCASYHLRGTCFSNCKRAADHHPHTEEEDALLYGWCQQAFA